MNGCDAASTKSPTATFSGKPTTKTFSCGISLASTPMAALTSSSSTSTGAAILSATTKSPPASVDHQPKPARARHAAAERQHAEAVGDGADQHVVAVDREEDEERQEVLPLRERR